MSTRADGKQQSATAHRHAAYKFMVLPFVEIYATYLAYSEFGSLRKAIDFLMHMAHDSKFAKDALLQPLNGNGIFILEMYMVTFFLGTFHYWYNQPFSKDRVWHKVLATILSFANFYLNDAQGALNICILLWKPAGAFESMFTLMHLRGLHKTMLGKLYVLLCTTFVFIDRWVFETLLLVAVLRAGLVYPGEVLFGGPRPLIPICFTALTMLHLKWAYRSAQTLPSFLFGESAHGLRFSENYEGQHAPVASEKDISSCHWRMKEKIKGA